jgi:hypothetical protein
MDSRGYAIVVNYYGQFELRFYKDVNNDSVWTSVTMSYSYDEIMRELIKHRELMGMGKEYWIS